MKDKISDLKWASHHLIHLVGMLEFIQDEFEGELLKDKSNKLITDIDEQLNKLKQINDTLKEEEE